MNKFFLFIITLIIASPSTTKKASFVYDTAIEIGVTDMDCNDLLNPSNPASFKKEEIKFFYLNQGVIEEVYNEMRDAKRNFLMYKNDNKSWRNRLPNSEYLMRLFPNLSSLEKLPVTYIQWNTEDTDTIQCEYDRSEGFVACSKVWLNGELVWNGSEPRHIDIVK